jgi:hypothetical protein
MKGGRAERTSESATVVTSHLHGNGSSATLTSLPTGVAAFEVFGRGRLWVFGDTPPQQI